MNNIKEDTLKKSRLHAGHGFRPKGRRAEAGFTLVEILIALAVTAVLMAGVLGLYQAFIKETTCQELILEAQQNARAGVQLIQGDLLMVGHRVPADVEPISLADDDAITIRYVDNNNNPLRITYTIDANNYLTRQLCQQNSLSDWTGCVNADSSPQVVLDNLSTTNPIAFTYSDEDGNELTTLPLAIEDRDIVRFVRTKIRTVTAKACIGRTDAGGLADVKTVEDRLETRLRNLYLKSLAEGGDPPPAPTGLVAREKSSPSGLRARGVCGGFYVTWDVPTGEDSGNVVKYNLTYLDPDGAGATVSKNVSTLAIDSSSGTDKYWTLLSPGRATDESGADAGWKIRHNEEYTVVVKAVNTENLSSVGISAGSVAGADTSGGSLGPGTGTDSDTFINALALPDVYDFTGADDPTDDAVQTAIQLSWNYYTTAQEPDVEGFKIYGTKELDGNASLTALDYPTILLEANIIGDIIQSAGVDLTTSADRAYEHSGLIGCRNYAYAIEPVNCDTDVIQPIVYTFGDGVEIGITDTPDNGVSNTTPGDLVPPALPTITASPGWKRVFIGVTNPLLADEQDFDYSVVYVNQSPGNSCTIDGTDYYPEVHNLTTDPLYGSITSGAPVPNTSTYAGATVPDNAASIYGWFSDDGTVSPPPTHTYMCADEADCPVPPVYNDVTLLWDTVTAQEPQLANDSTFCYVAVSYDTCGNPSAAEAAVKTPATLCSDDPNGPPGGATPWNATVDAGITATTDTWPYMNLDARYAGISVAGCKAASGLSVTFESMDHMFYSPTSYGYFDTAMYKVHVTGGDSTTLDIDNAGPTYKTFTEALDADKAIMTTNAITSGLVDGGTYLVGVMATDCAYETGTSATTYSDWLLYPDVLNPAHIGLPSVQLGLLDRDSKCADDDGLVDRVCGNSDGTDLHREVITGVTIDDVNGTGTSTSTHQASFEHDTITIFMENNSAGSMTLQSVSLSWSEYTAHLTGALIGGGRSGIIQDVTTITDPVSPAPAARTAADPASDYKWTISSVALSNTVIPGGTRYIPITLSFDDDGNGSGNPVDMRDSLIRFVLTYANSTTTSTACTSYLTVDEADGNFFVPLGPSVGEASQRYWSTESKIDYPAKPGIAVPGPEGFNTVFNIDIIKALVTMDVTATVTSQTVRTGTASLINVARADLYYIVTDQTIEIAPTSGYSSVEMTRKIDDVVTYPCGGATTVNCTGVIPATDGGKRVWYYIVSEDDDGNFDRSPETSSGAYAYDQKVFNACDFTPKVPANFALVDGGTTMDLSWDAVTTYTDDVPIPILSGDDSISYKVERLEGLDASWTPLSAGTSGCGMPLTDIFCTDGAVAGNPVDTANNDFVYHVMAYNTCDTKQNDSDPTGIKKVCRPGNSYIKLSPIADDGTTSIASNSAFNLTITNCAMAYNGMDEDGIDNVNMVSSKDSDTISMTEVADKGYFKQNIPTITTTPDSVADLAVADDPNVVLTSSNGDTITITHADASNTGTVAVEFNACDNTPLAPTDVAIANIIIADNLNDLDKQGGVYSANLSWTAPSFNMDGTAVIDLSSAVVALYRWTSSDNGTSWTNFGPVVDTGYILDNCTAAGMTCTLKINETADRTNAGLWIKYQLAQGDNCSNYSANTDDTAPIVVQTCTDTAPDAPTSLAYTYSDSEGNNPPKDAAADGTVGLLWSAPANGDIYGYRVYRSEDGGSTYTDIVDIVTDYNGPAATTYTDDISGLADYVSVTYRVTTLDFCGYESVVSDTTDIIMNRSCLADPDAPTVATDGTAFTHTDLGLNNPPLDLAGDDTATIAWTDGLAGDIVGYNIYRDTAKDFQVASSVTSGTPTNPIAVSPGTVLDFVVSSLDYCGREGDAPVSTLEAGICTAAPTTPASLTFTHNDANNNTPPVDLTAADTVGLEWPPPGDFDVAGYTLTRSSVGGVVTDVGNVTTFTDDAANGLDDINVPDKTEFNYTISAYDRCGLTSGSMPTSLMIKSSCTNPLAIPADFAFAHNDVLGNPVLPATSPFDGDAAGEVKLSWSANTEFDMAGYILERRDGAAGTWSALAPEPSFGTNSFTDSTYSLIASGTEVSYRLTAKDVCNNTSVASEIGPLYKGSCTDPLAAPVSVVYTHSDSLPNATPLDGTDAGAVDLSWAPVAGPTVVGYNVYRSDDLINPLNGVVPVTLTTYPDDISGLGDGTVVNYTIMAVTACGLEGAGVITTDITKGICGNPLATPLDLAFAHNDLQGNLAPNPLDGDAAGEVVLSWTANTEFDITGYAVGRKVGAAGTWAAIGTTATNAYTDTSYPLLTYTDEVYYRIAALDSCNKASTATAEIGPLYKGECSAGPAAPAVTLTHTDAGGFSNPPLDYTAAFTADFSWTVPDVSTVSYNVYEYGFNGAAWFQSAVIASPFFNTTLTGIGPVGWWSQTKYVVEAVNRCNVAGTLGESTVLELGSCNWTPSAPMTPWNFEYSHNDPALNLPPVDVSVAGEITLGFWNNLDCSPSANSYNIYEDKGLGYQLIDNYVGSGGCWINYDNYTMDKSGDPDGTTYSYYIIPVSKCYGTEGWTSGNLTTITKGSCTPLAMPAAPTFTNLPDTETETNGDVYLTWNAQALADSYSVQYASSVDVYATWTEIVSNTTDTTAIINMVDLGFADGTGFKFMVMAHSSCGAIMDGPYSFESAVIKLPACVPPRVTGVTLMNAPPGDVDGFGNIRLAWTPSPGPAHDVFQSTSADGGTTWTAFAMVANVNPPPFEATVLTGADLNGTQYKFYVKAAGPEACESAETDTVVKGTCADGAPAAPTWDFVYGLCGAPHRQMDLPVAANFDLKEYDVYWCTDGSACTVPQFEDTYDIPGADAGGGTTIQFDVNNGCGAYYKVAIRDYCGTTGTFSTSW